MSLRDRYSGEEKSDRPSSFTCEHYSAKPGSKRCIHYLANGACDRADEFMCVEWLKANRSGRSAAGCTKSGEVDEHCQWQSAVNHQSKPEPIKEKTRDDVDRDLFGNPLPPHPKPIEKSPPKIEKPPVPEPPPVTDAPLVRNLNDEEIASFKALGVEVCIKSEDVGEIWLVPEYTGQDRKEISVEHAATLSAVCAAFPGAKVASLEKKPNSSDDSLNDEN